MSILSVLTMSQSAEAETSEDFNGVELYFYGDLDDGDGNISTLIPVDESDTQSDCPTDSNQLSWPMGQRNWGEVGSWIVYFDTSGQLDTGDYTLTLWANSTQRICRTFAPKLAISSISSYDTTSSFLAFGTILGSAV